MNPNDADVIGDFRIYHTAVGDPQTGLRKMDMAIARNPYHTPVSMVEGFILLAFISIRGSVARVQPLRRA